MRTNIGAIWFFGGEICSTCIPSKL